MIQRVFIFIIGVRPINMNYSKNILPHSGIALIKNKFLDNESAEILSQKLTKEVHWQSRQIKMFGKLIDQPRLVCWMGDSGANYKYSGTLFKPEKWITPVLEIKSLVELDLNLQFNSCLLNLYRNERDSMGLHSDNEKELGLEPNIASVSLGSDRTFIFRHKLTKEKVVINLKSGSLLLMQGETQDNWKHELPKMKKNREPRINLTFRKVTSI